MKNILFLLISFSALFAAKPAISQPSARIAGGPYLQNVTPDGFTVIWTTTTDAAVWVETAPDDGTHFYAAERPKYYDSHLGRRRLGKLHRVRVGGLEPGKTYRYRIMQQAVLRDEGNKRVILGEGYGSDILKHEPYRATTLDPSRERIECWVVNDIHGRADYMAGLCRPIDFAQIDFVAFNGDMSNSTESPEQLYRDFIDASVGAFASETPILYNRGNHETRGIYADHLPEYFPKVGGNYYKLYMAGSVAVLLLDCGEDKPDSDIEYGGLGAYDAYREEEAAWLRETVASEEFRNASARIVLLHIPLGNGTWHGNIHLEELFLPILNDADIDVMLSGHTHRYSFHPANDKVRFPVLVNDNASLLKCDVGDGKITARIYGPEGTVTHSHEFPLK